MVLSPTRSRALDDCRYQVPGATNLWQYLIGVLPQVIDDAAWSTIAWERAGERRLGGRDDLGAFAALAGAATSTTAFPTPAPTAFPTPTPTAFPTPFPLLRPLLFPL